MLKINSYSWILIIVVVSLFLMDNLSVTAATSNKGMTLENKATVIVNGEKATFKEPILNKNGHLFLPMRNLYEMIGATVHWESKSKTASAERIGNQVAITLNSTTANVNGKPVTVNVPPFLYQDKTYVPIRFLSENLGGSVIWNAPTREVDIQLEESQEPSPPELNEPYYLQINNKRIVMTDPILSKQGRTYIAAKYLYENLDNATGKWLSGEQFELQISGLNFIFTNNNNIIQINNDFVTTSELPFIKQDQMYVPVKFIVNAVDEDGTLRYMSQQRELHIYLYQSMFTSNFLEKSFGATVEPQPIQTAQLKGARTLLMSDNPEMLTPLDVPDNTATLAAQTVRSSQAVNEHRVFAWHYNTLGTNSTLAITIENTSASTTLVVNNSKGTAKKSSHSWINYDVGLPIVDQVLNNKLQKTESEGMTIAPGETKIIQSYELLNHYIIGLLHDFDIAVQNGTDSSYTIRTVLAKNNEDVTLIHTSPVVTNKAAAHPRGVWPSSEIVAQFPTYTVDSAEIGFSISNGKTDHLLTKDNSLEQVNGSVGNPGHFGIQYMVQIPVTNPTGQEKELTLKFAGRGGLYSGALKVNGQVHLIPTLKSGQEYIELPYTVTQLQENITIEIMHSGGSNLPLAIFVRTK